MKEFKVYKVNAKPLVWGLDLPYFYIFIALVTLNAFVLISKITVVKLTVVSIIISISYIVLKFLSQKEVFLRFIKDKLPKGIRNTL